MDATQDPQEPAERATTPTPPVSAAPPPPVPPVTPAPAPPPASSAAAFPPPAYSPPEYLPPAAASSGGGSGKAIAIVLGIVAAAVLVLGGLGVAIYFVAQSAIRSIEEQGLPLGPDSGTEGPVTEGLPELLPLVEGEAGPAIAAVPTTCPDECFPYETFGEIGLDPEAYVDLGATEHLEEWGDYADTTPGKEYTYSARYWTEGEGTPAECFVTYTQIPLAATIDERPVAPDDTVAYLGYHTSADEYSSLQESVRLFTDSASAETHMSSLKDMLAGCSGYEIGTGSEYWTADVTPMPALALPDSVAAVGWVEESPFGRYYSADLQRGNIVIRASLFTDGAITEESYRGYVEALAEQLAGLATE